MFSGWDQRQTGHVEPHEHCAAASNPYGIHIEADDRPNQGRCRYCGFDRWAHTRCNICNSPYGHYSDCIAMQVNKEIHASVSRVQAALESVSLPKQNFLNEILHPSEADRIQLHALGVKI